MNPTLGPIVLVVPADAHRDQNYASSHQGATRHKHVNASRDSNHVSQVLRYLQNKSGSLEHH